MKRTIALLLGLMLVMGFALVACGEEEATTTTAATTATTAAPETTETTEAEAGAVDWSEAADYEGSEVTITGTVAQVSNLFEEKGIAKLLIRLGGDNTTDHFNAVLVLNADGTFPEYAAEYAGLVNLLVGLDVEVTGTVTINSFESAFEILLNDADNNTLPDDAMTGTLVVTSEIPESSALTPADAAALGAALLAQYQADGSPEDKTAYVVPDVDVAGTVFAVKDKGTFAIVSLGDETTPFNILIPYDVFEAADLTFDDLKAWIGSDIEAMGEIVVNDWGSLTEMQITDFATQIIIL